MFKVGVDAYTGIAFIIILGWPLALISNPIFILLLLMNSLIFAITWHYNSSEEASFWKGLNIISGSFSSGCVNISIFYVPVILIIAYIIATIN
jgi:hypothetical protein